MTTSFPQGSVEAVKHYDGSSAWKVSDEINKSVLDPVGVTYDDIGHVCVGYSSRLLVFDSLNGEFLQELKLKGIRNIRDINLVNDQLIVLHDNKISVYDVN